VTEERTPLQDLERRALTGNRFAVVQVISALRRYRACSANLLTARFADGSCVSADVTAFEDDIEEIENDVEEPT